MSASNKGVNGTTLSNENSMRCIFTTLLLVSLSLSSALAHWNRADSLLGGRDAKSIFFADDRHGWIVGSDGLILRTENGGTEWTNIEPPTTQNLNSTFFVDTLVGWAVGEFGAILRTEDGGKLWESIISNTKVDFFSVHFQTRQSGWAAGQGGILAFTNDGGINWSVDSSGWIRLPNGDVDRTNGWTNSLYSITAINNEVIVVGGGGIVLKRNQDSGTWIKKKNIPTDRPLLAVSSTKDGELFAVGYDGVILSSEDAGETWVQRVAPNINSPDLHAVQFSGRNGWAVGNAALLKTTDNGVTWTDHKYGGNERGWRGVHFINSDTGWVVGLQGQVRMTTTGGYVPGASISRLPLSSMSLSASVSNGILKLYFPEAMPVKVGIYEIQGRLIEEFNLLKQRGDHVLDLRQNPISQGLYFLKIEAGGLSSRLAAVIY